MKIRSYAACFPFLQVLCVPGEYLLVWEAGIMGRRVREKKVGGEGLHDLLELWGSERNPEQVFRYRAGDKTWRLDFQEWRKS